MRKEEQLLRDLTELLKETQSGQLTWDILCQTTEYNDAAEKPVEELDGEKWMADECFVSYHCVHREKEFLMITYEKIYTCGEKKKSTNLIFLPPLGIRYFDLDILAPYAVQAGQMLAYDAHMLWLGILEQYRSHPEQITMQVEARPSA
ncbi:MAG: hypothetical protein NC355_02200 [Blautia sp.]|nr:hypothetical protein [Blautia sp.]